MDKIVIAINGKEVGNQPVATQQDKDQAYKSAIDQFTNSKGDVDVDTLRKILKAISSLVGRLTKISMNRLNQRKKPTTCLNNYVIKYHNYKIRK